MLVHPRFGPAPMSGHRCRWPLGTPRPRCGTSVSREICHGCALHGQGGRARLRSGREGCTVATSRRPSLFAIPVGDASLDQFVHIIENVTVVRRRVAHMIAPHRLVPTVHVDMVLVAVMASAVFLGPPRLDILLAPLCRLVLPAFRCLSRLYPRVLLAAIALFGHRHDRSVDDLAAYRRIALILQLAVERSKDQKPI